ncbi:MULTISPECIES: hypothetical protein [unclassified Microbacterium]|uniref:hypothetical protein n=1 Tax=unclassified Microbacterium TaxID=2609290 RepID=UPI000DE2EEAC|nr:MULTISPECIES: hypothetical protein [unclassified Microbacterium]RBO71657.1 hypothetical protein DSP71_15250 [Microbacterium sp. H6]
MAEKNVTIWTCDRCGAPKETEQGDQPTLWSGLMIIHPVNASPDAERTVRHQLCGECTSDLGFFLNPPEAAPADA